MPALLGITESGVKALPKFLLAWPNRRVSPQPPARHIGHKLKAEMQRLGLSHKQIADLFGVKVPSVYDWLSSGRMAKRHYSTLVEVFGHPITWWFDMEPPRATGIHVVREDLAAYDAVPDQDFLSAFNQLPASEQAAIKALVKEKSEHYRRIFEEMTLRRNAS